MEDIVCLKFQILCRQGLEWGAGSGTLWFLSGRMWHLTTVEHDSWMAQNITRVLSKSFAEKVCLCREDSFGGGWVRRVGVQAWFLRSAEHHAGAVKVVRNASMYR